MKQLPESLRCWSVDEVAECINGITAETSQELWNLLREADEAGKAKPIGGDGSNGTTEEPIVSSGEYASDLAAAWPKLSEKARENITESARIAKAEHDAFYAEWLKAQ